MTIHPKNLSPRPPIGKPVETPIGTLIPINNPAIASGGSFCNYCAIEYNNNLCNTINCATVVFVTIPNFITYQLTGAVPKAR